ncbi:hypothetical protein ACI784_09115 [Geodermatophilus sp. SYSU D01186]
MAAELDLFSFVLIRDAEQSRRHPYTTIRDVTLDVDPPYGYLNDRDPFSAGRTGIAGPVYDAVFCWTGTRQRRMERLQHAALDLLAPLVADCPGIPDPPGGPADPSLMLRALREAPESILVDPRGNLEPPQSAPWRLSPAARPTAPTALIELIGDAIAATLAAASTPSPPPTDRQKGRPDGRDQDIDRLVERIRALLGDIDLLDLTTGTNPLVEWRRDLLDRLHLIVVLQRWYTVDASPFIAALKVLSVVEALARDALVLRTPRLRSKAELDRVGAVAFAEYTTSARGLVTSWDRKSVPAGFPRIRTVRDLSTFVDSLTVSVHPLFIRLFDVLEPLRLRPIGIGDLNVVRDELVGYEALEIADINNVMKGERRSRTSKRLERSEESFSTDESTVTESSTETVRDDRSSLKSAIENEIASALKVNADVSLKVQYGDAATLNTTGGINYGLDTKRRESVGTEFARSVTAKAASRVEQRITTARSTKLLTETTNTVTFSFDNTATNGRRPEDVSGIYTWVRKRYRAQVYCYGRRLMYEIVIPEPARQLVAMLRAQIEESIQLPRKPADLQLETVTLDFTAAEVNDTSYRILASQYDLSALPPPRKTASVRVAGTSNGGSFAQVVDDGKQKWRSFGASFGHDLDGYEIVDVTVTGEYRGEFDGGPATPSPNEEENNKLQVRIEGQTMVDRNFGKVRYNALDDTVPAATSVVLSGSSASLSIDVYNCQRFSLAFWLRLKPSAALIEEWQNAVTAAVRAAKQREVDVRNTEERSRYLSETRDYQSALDDIEALALDDFLATISPGKAETMIRQELRRIAIGYLTRPFDGQPGDEFSADVLATDDVDMDVAPFTVDRTVPTAAFATDKKHPVSLTRVKFAEAARRGRFVQFLEQAFDWKNLSYIAYPYYWAHRNRWLDSVSRTARSDPKFEAFLQAGSVRVLVPATAGYEAASLMFAASGIPWLGREAPTMADPLFRSVADEVRASTQDDGTPVGDPWEYTLPTDLLYLHDSSTPLPQPK